MSNWQKVKLGEIAQIIDGDRGKNYPKNNEFFDKGFCLFLNTGNVTQDGFSFESNQFITEEKDSSLRKGKLTRGDLVYTTRGTVGNIAFYDRNVQFHNVRINSGMVILRANEQYVIASFLYQLLKSDATRRYIKSFCTGSAQPQLPIKNLSQILLDFPPKDVQHRIATILSRYDSLIENYQKQIKLLEEAAQRLYKEWFVDLRFPGHENTKIVDGVPEGWEKKALSEVSNLKAGGDKPDIVSEERTSDCNIPIYSNGTSNEGLYGYTQVPEITEQSVTISARGSVGYTVLRRKPYLPIVRLISVIPGNIYVGYLYFFLKNTSFDSNGAAQQQITIPMIRNKEITIPCDSIIKSFKQIVEPQFAQIDILKEQIRLLTEARDRLLPKLMSGEIAV